MNSVAQTTQEIVAEEFFRYGSKAGALNADAPSYVTRAADAELQQATLRGEYCNVLAARQMGKSSLKARAAQQLKAQQVHTVTIDLSRMGTQTEAQAAEQWYFGLVSQFKRQLQLDVDAATWWREQGQLSPVQRFADFVRYVVLEEISGAMVVFIDEIDSTLNLPFTDDFFAAIRAMYNARADDPVYRRIAFVLLGVARPADLIKDVTRTPYNIGVPVDVADFSPEEAQTLLPGLAAAYPAQAEALLARILYWTGGHPYLTQKLCWEVVQRQSIPWDAAAVDALATELFFSDAARKESNLQFVQNRVLHHPQRDALLRLYRRVLRGAQVRDDGQSLLQNELKLAGLVVVAGGVLRVRNPIYCRVFDAAWIRANLPTNWMRLALGLVALVAILAVGLIAYSTWANAHFQQCYYRFDQTADPAERREILADTFRLWNPLNPVGYGRDARDLFFSLSREEQLALFRGYAVDEHELVAVVQGLYTTLADVEGDGASTPLLAAMHAALAGSASAEGQALHAELAAWLAGRAAAAPEAALEAYTAAVAQNADNPATLYERARVYATLGRDAEALADLERLLGVALDSPEPTATPAPPETPTVTAYPTLTPAPDVGSALTPTLEATPPVTATPGITATLPVAPTAVPVTTTPAPTPPPLDLTAPFVTQFGDLAQRRSAVRALLERLPALVAALQAAPETAYPNLRELSLGLTTRVRAADGMAQVLVRGGEFQMGSEDGDSDEQPVHQVMLSDFWLDRTEVTNRQFVVYLNGLGAAVRVEDNELVYYNEDVIYDLICTNCTNWEERIVWDGAQFSVATGYEEHPVVLVSWYGAAGYCVSVGASLPTEAQWEYAARGPENFIYPWGNTWQVGFANCSEDFCEDGYDRTAPVGSFPAGASWAGVVDLSGNVWEWTADWYGDYPAERQVNPTGPVTGTYRVVRGGGWYYIGYYLRAANRNDVTPALRDLEFGFRCAGGAPGN